MIAEFTLQPEVKELASILAERTFAKYRNVNGHYRNTTNSHLVGHLGEFAAHLWFQEQGMQSVPLFLDPKRDKECDIEVDCQRVEIKTWTDHHWEKWGRCISVSQYSSIVKKADSVFFLTIEEAQSSTPVARVQGWVDVDVYDGIQPIWTGNSGREINNLQIAQSELRGVKEWKESKFCVTQFA